PGGSSGGSAASLSAGIGWFSIGEDTGGSIRQPAAFCGVCGLKPTYGRVSRYGSIAYASSLDTVGPMARSASDLRAVFDTVVGPDENDATSVHSVEKENRSMKTIGLPKEFFADLSSEQSNVVERAVDTLKKDGMKIKEVTLPSTKYAISTYYLLATAETSSNLARFDGIRYGHDRCNFSRETKRRIMLGTYVLSAGYYDQYYALAQKVRSKIIQEYRDVFQECDVLLAPVSPIPPFKVGELTTDPLEMYLADALTVPVNVAGLPALALPAGFEKNNLPVGLQLIGPQGSDETLLDLGQTFQKETDFHTKRPEKP
ncbi:MAG: amidase family protein, partial [bacterium]|nr:amidase family protein [bacterium]